MSGRRVLVAHPSADLYGSDRVLLESVSALTADGTAVTVTVPDEGPLVAELEKRGATVVFCPTPVLRKNVRTPGGFVRFVTDAVLGTVSGLRLIRAEKPDAVYVNTITVPLWLALARLRGVPSLCHVHEAEGSAGRLTRIAMATPLLLATRILANSEYSVDVLQKSIPVVAARTRVLHNAVPGPVTAQEARQELLDGIRLVYVGRLSPRKGVDVAVAAVAELAARGVAVRLDVVGSVFPGYEWYEEDLRAQAAPLANVRFLGYRDPIWEVLAEADAVVVPSRYDEPFGNTAVEAILARRPVIVSATSGLREATAGYLAAQRVAPSRPDAVADAVETLASRWSEFRDAATEDRQLALDRHGLERYSTQITGLVNELVSGVPAPAAPPGRPRRHEKTPQRHH